MYLKFLATGVMASLLNLAASVGASALDHAGEAAVRCGPFSFAPDKNPAWEFPGTYNIKDNLISFSRTPGKAETKEEWHGLLANSGNILLVGRGESGTDGWAMEFSGFWQGAEKTTLKGKYVNVRGATGQRVCTIQLK